MLRTAPSPSDRKPTPAAGPALGGEPAPNLQAISLFRIAFAAYLLVDFLISDLPYFTDLYGDGGALPLAALGTVTEPPGLVAMLPLLRLLDGRLLAVAFPVAYVASLLALAVGWRARAANAVAFALNSYLYWRNPEIGSGAEMLAHLLLLWCLFLPLNRYWSVDAALDPAPRDRPYPALPFVAIRLQIASLYLFAALFKLAGRPWRSGEALAQAMSDNVFGGTPTSLFLIGHFPGLLHAATYLVIGFQLAFPFLIYAPWRNGTTRAVALAGTALMHGAFIVCLNIGGFPYLCLAMLLLLVPDAWLDRLLQRRRARLAGITIFYEPVCGFCRRTALLLREFLLTPAVPVLPASADPAALRLLEETRSWVVRAPDRTNHLKWRALAYLLKQSTWAAPLGWLSDAPPLRAPLARVYDAIGAQRRRLGPIAAALLPFRTESTPSRPAVALCGVLALLAFASNVASVARLSIAVPPLFDMVPGVLQVRQHWLLFAPVPTHVSWNFRFIARRVDGSTLDLMAALPEPLVRSSAGGGPLAFASPRWLKYFTSLNTMNDSERAALGAYLCRRAAAVPALAVTRQIEVTLAKQLIEPGPAPETLYDYRFDCAPAVR